ncbi:unnamed protein product [Macrosiphum euphorbiae]|uniref:Uncharacterized protein n=1 Tax=Macrosiphum euphorbiae TaxID=13131 RepID=A0AAV0Y3V7_9HEMI|nr:unnamed protein product [Macrosiphum euphorbiae]
MRPSANRHTPALHLRPTQAAHTTPVQLVKQAYAPKSTQSSTGQTRITNTSAKKLQPAPTASGLTRQQQRDKARLREYMATKRAKTTQQHRLNNKLEAHSTPPATPLPPASRDNMVVDGQPPAGSSTAGQATDTPIPNTAETIPEEMEISPEEENDVLRDKTPEYLGKVENDHDATWWSTTSVESSPKKQE